MSLLCVHNTSIAHYICLVYTFTICDIYRIALKNHENNKQQLQHTSSYPSSQDEDTYPTYPTYTDHTSATTYTTSYAHTSPTAPTSYTDEDYYNDYTNANNNDSDMRHEGEDGRQYGDIYNGINEIGVREKRVANTSTTTTTAVTTTYSSSSSSSNKVAQPVECYLRTGDVISYAVSHYYTCYGVY